MVNNLKANFDLSNAEELLLALESLRESGVDLEEVNLVVVCGLNDSWEYEGDICAYPKELKADLNFELQYNELVLKA